MSSWCTLDVWTSKKRGHSAVSLIIHFPKLDCSLWLHNLDYLTQLLRADPELCFWEIVVVSIYWGQKVILTYLSWVCYTWQAQRHPLMAPSATCLVCFDHSALLVPLQVSIERKYSYTYLNLWKRSLPNSLLNLHVVLSCNLRR